MNILNELRTYLNDSYEHVSKVNLSNKLDEIEARIIEEKPDRTIFENTVEPVMEYLAEKHHPHCTLIITSTHAELVEGIMAQNTDKFIVD